MLAVIWAQDIPDSAPARGEHLAAHLAYIESNMATIRVAGPWLGDDGAMIGSMYVIEVDSLAAAHAWIAADPYSAAGVWQSCRVWPYYAAAGTWVGGRNW